MAMSIIVDHCGMLILLSHCLCICMLWVTRATGCRLAEDDHRLRTSMSRVSIVVSFDNLYNWHASEQVTKPYQTTWRPEQLIEMIHHQVGFRCQDGGGVYRIMDDIAPARAVAADWTSLTPAQWLLLNRNQSHQRVLVLGKSGDPHGSGSLGPVGCDRSDARLRMDFCTTFTS